MNTKIITGVSIAAALLTFALLKRRAVPHVQLSAAPLDYESLKRRADELAARGEKAAAYSAYQVAYSRASTKSQAVYCLGALIVTAPDAAKAAEYKEQLKRLDPLNQWLASREGTAPPWQGPVIFLLSADYLNPEAYL